MILKKKTDTGTSDEKRLRASKWYIVSSILLALAVLFTLYVTIQTLTVGYANVFGYSVFRVVTGSMEPTMPINTVLLCKSEKAENIAVGDIICFKSKESSHYGVIVTHRVVSIHVDVDGVLHLESRGDANYSSDPYYVTNDNLVGRVVWFKGKEGVLTNLLAFITGKFGFVALIAFPILLIAGMILKSVGSNIRGELDATIEKLSEIEKEDKEKNENENQEEPLPGYETLTKRDYDEIYEKLKEELLKELNVSAEGSETKTE